ncbi:NADH dehydrogenase I chain A [Buchnera aphidicola str. Bp (Baizongia pistaciae)]|uniref:NADH-quinone oxidoreductase subunit A n=1 Tax=Buchnera aphidicola subsp. Baizongia pistaciae (strain Bp) TaxID=224915 RepID=NUOA_BUCBP|nr:NADH-quinone oxidoreductase subunit A [Buchnera aphidicola]Q89AU6.1 RecName: Full=NADH-quinone oxidoreductase subunit A; AltName: Full=NADH dehydrogenase I subunit A; AltName: Full=NDH-1 subunit A; AltName: Full=NUO1 [Buchnera aphidicola str. Bp (Baizongia pistaciae)]AAO26877.1 NADH dehydrogenase I chain A [Buchnera aphidicola str. Bp (Baizongia pistaciae)]
MLKSSVIAAQYWAFFTFFFIAVSICVFMLSISWILGGRSSSRYKNTPFESGIVPTNTTNMYCSVKFYLVAIYFVLFDVEALYLYAWSVSIVECGWIGFIEALIFILFLLSGLIYLISSKLLVWKSKNNIHVT